uniref:Uncharacterized protein n=1 Tax=Zea mays TaxID=4577 RepID=A0A804LL38_MAIZE
MAYSKIRRRVVAAPPRPASEAAGGVRLIGVARGAGERPIVFVPLKPRPWRGANRWEREGGLQILLRSSLVLPVTSERKSINSESVVLLQGYTQHFIEWKEDTR